MTADRSAVPGDLAPVPAPGVAAADLDGDTVLYLETTGEVHVLNSTAGAVFHAFDGTATVDAVVEELARAFSADPEVVRSGVVEITDQLIALGVLGFAGEDPKPPIDLEKPDEPPYRYLRPPSI